MEEEMIKVTRKLFFNKCEILGINSKELERIYCQNNNLISKRFSLLKYDKDIFSVCSLTEEFQRAIFLLTNIKKIRSKYLNIFNIILQSFIYQFKSKFQFSKLISTILAEENEEEKNNLNKNNPENNNNENNSLNNNINLNNKNIENNLNNNDNEKLNINKEEKKLLKNETTIKIILLYYLYYLENKPLKSQISSPRRIYTTLAPPWVLISPPNIVNFIFNFSFVERFANVYNIYAHYLDYFVLYLKYKKNKNKNINKNKDNNLKIIINENNNEINLNNNNNNNNKDKEDNNNNNNDFEDILMEVTYRLITSISSEYFSHFSLVHEEDCLKYNYKSPFAPFNSPSSSSSSSSLSLFPGTIPHPIPLPPPTDDSSSPSPLVRKPKLISPPSFSVSSPLSSTSSPNPFSSSPSPISSSSSSSSSPSPFSFSSSSPAPFSSSSSPFATSENSSQLFSINLNGGNNLNNNKNEGNIHLNNGNNIEMKISKEEKKKIKNEERIKNGNLIFDEHKRNFYFTKNSFQIKFFKKEKNIKKLMEKLGYKIYLLKFSEDFFYTTKNLKIFRLLINNYQMNFDHFDRGTNAILIASKYGNIEVVSYLLSLYRNDPNIEKRNKLNYYFYGKVMLRECIKNGKIDLFKYLIEVEKFNYKEDEKAIEKINFRDFYQQEKCPSYSLFCIAAQFGRENFLDYLLEVDQNYFYFIHQSRDQFGDIKRKFIKETTNENKFQFRSPVLSAIFNSHFDIALKLLQKNFSIESEKNDNHFFSLLVEKSSGDQNIILKFLKEIDWIDLQLVLKYSFNSFNGKNIFKYFVDHYQEYENNNNDLINDKIPFNLLNGKNYLTKIQNEMICYYFDHFPMAQLNYFHIYRGLWLNSISNSFLKKFSFTVMKEIESKIIVF